ncbi:uncharacterized protein LAESUDRAFT_810943 [Laetiporus sulphureus 93-53]|uniref:Uncharacterized protein n=1 Tax=Laetiporus sulphureus 93-53 TaxID=1314785 RepID=A0A165FS20_9APHY|nr:uncharacterized protein LAESUDRAFT_810943 [Laetiporus sulphureus 93-53]KZT09337.1 hypothetical protein LAESUDRAFT_810943 [Laetiporus sulphureus 93-53]
MPKSGSGGVGKSGRLRTQDAPYVLSLSMDESVLPGSMTDDFLVLPSYQRLFARAWKLYLEDPDRGILVTGQPGIGKSTWLRYALIRLLKKQQVVLFAQDERYHLFYHDCVYTISSGKLSNDYLPRPPENGYFWGLIDSDKRAVQPHSALLDLPIFPVQAASPNRIRYRQWLKQREGFTLELQKRYKRLRAKAKKALERSEDRSHQADDAVANVLQISRKEAPMKAKILAALNYAIELYGYSARDIYAAVFTPNEMAASFHQALNDASFKDIFNILPHTNTTNPDTLSHWLVTVVVSPKDSINYSDDFGIDSKSNHIMEKLKVHFEKVQHEEARQMMMKCRTFESGSFRGFIFEKIAHNYLSGAEDVPNALPPLVPMRKSKRKSKRKTAADAPAAESKTEAALVSFSMAASPQESDFLDIFLPVRAKDIRVVDFQHDTFSEGICQYFYAARSPNSPLFDSFFVELQEDVEVVTAIIWLFQVTLRERHEGSTSGYQLIQKIKGLALARAQKRAKHGLDQFAIEQEVSTVGSVRSRLPERTAKKRTWVMPEGWDKHEGEVYGQLVPDGFSEG